MTRRRYVQIDGVLHEVSPDYTPEPRRLKGDAALWNDRTYQDAGDKRFGSRTQHREYMKRNNLTTTDDYSTEWKKAEQQRIAIRQGIDHSRKQDISQAIEQLQRGKRS